MFVCRQGGLRLLNFFCGGLQSLITEDKIKSIKFHNTDVIPYCGIKVAASMERVSIFVGGFEKIFKGGKYRFNFLNSWIIFPLRKFV